MLKIRLSRTGKKRQPSFRIVVQEHTAPIKGKFVESLGYYKPADDPKVFSVDMERVKYWISVGAQPSDSMAVLLKKEGLEGMEKFIEPRDKQRKKKQSRSEAEAPKPKAEETEKPEVAEKVEEEPKPEEPPKEEPKEEAPSEEKPVEEPKPEEKPEEKAEEPPKEEAKEEPKKEDPPPPEK